jgi:hypothetical protein
MIRANCVLCNSSSLNDIFTLSNYPITPSSNNLDHSTDEFQDCIFMSCANCSCIQLKTLIDPIKLYSNSHNSTEETPTWKEHHRLFADFIKDNNMHDTILEIGGNGGILYKLLSSYAQEYILMDICDSEMRPKEVKFIQGNCEDFNFTGHRCIVLSHTFEHLYNPREFITNLHTAKVDSVFISIPNMDYLYSSGNMSILHNEHTFFIRDNEIKRIFLEFGYSCKTSYDFRNHSRFYHFIYHTKLDMIPIDNTNEYIIGFQHILLKYETLLKALDITMPFFICPAGHYGQKIYYYLQRFSSHLKGFIDNDVSKQNKRVYGTLPYVHSPDILKTYRDNPVCIILYAGPYTNELKTQLNLLHSFITYITI